MYWIIIVPAFQHKFKEYWQRFGCHFHFHNNNHERVSKSQPRWTCSSPSFCSSFWAFGLHSLSIFKSSFRLMYATLCSGILEALWVVVFNVLVDIWSDFHLHILCYLISFKRLILSMSHSKSGCFTLKKLSSFHKCVQFHFSHCTILPPCSWWRFFCWYLEIARPL